MKNTYEECKGCRHGYCGECLVQYHISPKDKCPCANCIIKSMCHVMCELRRELFDHGMQQSYNQNT